MQKLEMTLLQTSITRLTVERSRVWQNAEAHTTNLNVACLMLLSAESELWSFGGFDQDNQVHICVLLGECTHYEQLKVLTHHYCR